MLVFVSRCLKAALTPLGHYFFSRFVSGGEIDSVDKDGNTPLHIAARYGHELLINTLITSGADCTRFVCLFVDLLRILLVTMTCYADKEIPMSFS